MDSNNLTPQKTSTMAIVSLVLGIISIPLDLCCIGIVPGIVGLILGIISLKSITNNPDKFKGKNLAIAGIVTSGVAIILAIIIMFIKPSVNDYIKNHPEYKKIMEEVEKQQK